MATYFNEWRKDMSTENLET